MSKFREIRIQPPFRHIFFVPSLFGEWSRFVSATCLSQWGATNHALGDRFPCARLLLVVRIFQRLHLAAISFQLCPQLHVFALQGLDVELKCPGLLLELLDFAHLPFPCIRFAVRTFPHTASQNFTGPSEIEDTLKFETAC